MRCQIIGRGIEVTPAMKEQTENKLSRLDKYFDLESNVKCFVTFSVGHHDQTVEISVTTKNIELRAKVSQADAYQAIDLVIDKLEGQMRKFKTQFTKIHKKAGLSENIRMDMIDDEVEEDLDVIVKRKKLALVPMDAEEAAARMEALDHSFFIYLDSDTGLISVLYKRESGDLGVIEIDE